MTALGDAALAYAVAGYQVFPLRGKLPHANCPACEPRSPCYRAHRPADCCCELCHGLCAATSDPQRVARWWARWPQANIAGRVPAGLLVLDVDPRHGGLDRLAELERPSTAPCRPPGSACPAAATAASTAGSCTPAVPCWPPDSAPAWT